jgi:hypothetical protein
MPLDEWQVRWAFDFEREFRAETGAAITAEKANRFWWLNQNKALGDQCHLKPDCWLPKGHQGHCEPVA